MLSLADIQTLEEDENATPEEIHLALQRAINSGTGWGLQGSYGRSMMDAISSGRCLLGRSGTRDFFNNYIPSRAEVKQGTKGSYDYVKQHYGEEWADLMEGV